MKKTVLALAVMTPLAGSALAQSSVTLYGLVDVGLVRESGGMNGTVTKVNSGIGNGSRIGFKGTEQLGGDWTAFFDLQNGFQADTGAAGQGGLLFGRQAFVGVGSPFGSVKLGRQYSPIDELIVATDPFNNGYGGRLQNVFVKGYLARVDNDVSYSTPVINGFSASVATGLGETATPSANRFIGASAGYSAGQLFVRLAHNERNHMVVSTTPNTVFGNATSDRNTMLGATYDFGMLKLHGAYAATSTKNLGTTLVDADDAMIGVSAPFGASKVIASYVRRDDKSANNRDAHQIAVGYNYFLSKRTTLYAAYARISQHGPVFYTAGTSVEVGSGDKALDIGIRHTF